VGRRIAGGGRLSANKLKPFDEIIVWEESHLPDPNNFFIGSVFQLPDLTLWEVIDDGTQINNHAYQQVQQYKDEHGATFAVVAVSGPNAGSIVVNPIPYQTHPSK
jgi:hypothetical protein